MDTDEPTELTNLKLNLRSPSTSSSATTESDGDGSSDGDFAPPDTAFLQGTWHVTHSTLPMWKSNRNVTITYTSLEHDANMLDDLVEYQPLNSDKHKSVEGVDTPDSHVKGAYNWRGRGWLRIVSSHWEVLGFGEEDGGWMVTYFQKTLFTPAGLDIYSRRRGGLSDELLEQIEEGLSTMDDESLQRLAKQLFPIHHNW